MRIFSAIEGFANSEQLLNKDYDDLSLSEKFEMTIDEVLSLYLREVSRKVNEDTYKQVLRFVILYRECINKYGWIKKGGHHEAKPFSSVTEADFIPEICNELVTDYFEEKITQFNIERDTVIDLTRNLCHWLLTNSFTMNKLTMKPI
jgi:hypothetical protein